MSDAKQLRMSMENVMKDTERFLADLKGHKHTKGIVKKDVQNLKEHLERLIGHINRLEIKYVRQ